MKSKLYRGRFAPSPTGPLHYGSLLTATASYLQARSNGGHWFIRIENIDPEREPKGSVQSILECLTDYGFKWDGHPILQNKRIAYHQHIAQQLLNKNLAYRCVCSRKNLAANAMSGPMGVIYPGTCRNLQLPAQNNQAIRIKTNHTSISFVDHFYGLQECDMATHSGDYVILRTNQLPSYIFASSLDDLHEHYTQIVRGNDLLPLTGRQIHLSNIMGHDTAEFFHLPIITDPHGEKLSKQTHAPALKKAHARHMLVNVLEDLGQGPPRSLRWQSLATVWAWAFEHWDNTQIPNTDNIIFLDR